MERLRSPILFLVLMLLPFFLYFTGWRYWWAWQISSQLLLCLAGLFFHAWRLPALVTLALLLFFNLPWFDITSEFPGDCKQQIDYFSGIAEKDHVDDTEYLRLIKVEIWCRGEFVRWPAAELKNVRSRPEPYSRFRIGDRIQLKHISIRKRNRYMLEIEAEFPLKLTNISYRDRVLSRSGLLIYIQKKARYFLQPISYAIYKALITADRSSLTDARRRQIRDLGIAHLFAISGMHIGILYLWFSLAVRWVISFPVPWIERGAGILVTDLVTLLTIFIYLQGIGMPISAERSFVMLTWWSLMRHFLGWQPLWFILFGTAVLILLGSPMAIGQISFQLSFLSVAGIIQILPFLPQRRLKDSTGRILLKMILASFMVSLWLFVLTMPLVSRLSQQFSLITAFNNVVHIFYLSFVFLPFSLLVMFVTLLGYHWGGLFFEYHLYSIINFLGRLWSEMLTLNTSWNRYFMVDHVASWNFVLVLIWMALLTLPFLAGRLLDRGKKI